MNKTEKALLDLLRKLSEQDAQTLLRFAAFLANETAQEDVPVMAADAKELAQPELIERPENERVVDALKRLSASYPMLEKKQLLDKASELVAQHVMFGKPANIVIDEIEDMFASAYKKFAQEAKKT